MTRKIGRTLLNILVSWWFLPISAIWGAPPPVDLQSPTSAMQSLIRAAATMDAHLWAQCVSTTDRPALDASLGPRNQRHFQELKQQFETGLGRRFGEDLYEFALFLPIVDTLRGKALPENARTLTHILEERIWDDRYAEVVTILPFEVRGYLPPLTFFFLRENGQWRFCQWLTSAMILGWNTHSYLALNPAVRILLKAHADLDLDRGNCANFKRRTFPLPKAVSTAYRTASQHAEAGNRAQILVSWALTGDQEAERLVAEENARSPQAGVGDTLNARRKSLSNMNACGPRPIVPAGDGLQPDSPEFWFATAENDIIALRALPKHFPHEGKWCMAARVRIAGILFGQEAYEGSAAEYADAARQYPDFPDQVVEAKGRLARIYWEMLNRQGDAVRLWQELKAIGRLPADAALGERPLVPVTLLEDGKSGSSTGDFEIGPDGSLIVLRFSLAGEQRAGTQLTKLELHDAAGAFLKTLVQEESQRERPEEMFRALQRSGERIFVELNSGYDGRVLIFDGLGSFQGEMIRRGERFQVSTGRGAEPGYDEDNDLYPQAFHMANESFAILTRTKVRVFDYQGNPSRLVAVPDCGMPGTSSARMTGNGKGDLLVAQPGKGKVFRIDRSGTLTSMNYPETPEGHFTGVSHLFPDQAGNILLVDPPSRKVLKFDRSGKFVRSFSHESIAAPSSATVDEQGNISVIGYGPSGAVTVTQIDSAGQFLRAIALPAEAEYPIPGTSLDIEISRGEIYAIIDQSVIRCDPEGTILSRYESAGQGRIEHLVRDSGGHVYFTRDGQLYLYDAASSRPVVFPSDTGGNGAASGEVDLQVVGFDRNGSLIGITSEGRHFRTELVPGASIKVQEPAGPLLSGSLFAADPEGNIVAYEYGERKISIVAPDGQVLFSIASPAGTRSRWHPQEIAFDRQDNVYVYDSANRSMLKFLANGRLVSEIDLSRQLVGTVDRIRIDADDHLFMLSRDSAGRRIVRLDLTQMF